MFISGEWSESVTLAIKASLVSVGLFPFGNELSCGNTEIFGLDSSELGISKVALG